VRGAICNFIDRATPFKACCEAGDGEAAVAKARKRTPDLVILDLSMPMLYGVETASALHSMVPSAKIIGLAMFAGEYRRTELAAAGFHSIVSKKEGLAELAEAIKVLLPHAEPQAGEALRTPFDILKIGNPGHRPLVSAEMHEELLSSIRILIADDFKDWRSQVLLLFKTRPEWQVIAEAADGLEAIQKAEELKPDLIVLDIGLPKLDGIEAARQIRQLSPSSKILFLSQNNDLDVVRAALGTAQGYVYKTDLRRDFLPAIQAVLRGQRFVSSSLKGYEFTYTAGEKAPHRHELLMFSDDTVLLDSFTHFIAAALKADNAAIALVTKSHQESLRQRLKAEGVDTDGAIQEGTFILLDVADTLATLLVDGLPDPVRFLEDFSGLIKEAAKAAKAEHPRVAFCGECLGRLWAEGKTDAAIRLEQGCDELVKTHEVDILCAYPLRSFHGEEDEHIFQSICAEHSAAYSQ